LPCATKLSRSSLAPARAPDLALAQLDLNDIEVDDNGAVDETDREGAHRRACHCCGQLVLI
jgi:hypothetical protein